MDPVTMSIVGGLVNMGVGAITNWLAGSSDEEEKRQRLEALKEYTSIAAPEHKELIAREVARSRMEDLRRNPALEATQDEVLSSLMEVGRNGESVRGAAEYEQSAQDSAQIARSQRMGAVESASARGMGPEAAFTDLLMAGQGDADRERMAGLNRAAYGEEARMGALSQAGGMAAQRSATQWGQDADVAQAEDELNMFNAGQWNRRQEFNRDDLYRSYDAKLARADRIARQHGELGDMYAQRGQRTRDQGAAIGGGVNRMITAPGVYGPSGGNTGGGAPPAAAAAAPPPTAQRAPIAYQRPVEPAQQRQQLQTGTPTTSATRRRAR